MVTEEFEHGLWSGKVSTRLDNHDRLFDKINGSMGDIATELEILNIQVQKLADQADASAKTAAATAAALRDAEAMRRLKAEDDRVAAESKWSPFQRISLMISIVAGLTATIVATLSIISSKF